MKNSIFNWPGRLWILLFPAALAASFLAPAEASAAVHMSNGGGDDTSMEGDPLDTNDYGGGGGGGEVIHNERAGGSRIPPIFEFDLIQVFLIPEVVGGKVTFRILVVERTESGPVKWSLEGTHAQ